MKITVRIPGEPYAYHEIEYDSLAEYKGNHRQVLHEIAERTGAIYPDNRAQIKKEDIPF